MYFPYVFIEFRGMVNGCTLPFWISGDIISKSLIVEYRMEIDLNYWNHAISWGLLVLIWVVQLVHYPSFQFIDKVQFADFHAHHTRSISFIVLPLMLLELGFAAILVLQHAFQWNYLVPLILVLCIWASTFLIQVPDHNRLADGKDVAIATRLVQTNWIRTILWTLKAVWLWLFTTL